MSDSHDSTPNETRRGFLRHSALGAAGAVALTAAGTAAAVVPPTVPRRWDIEADVVVLGFGGAGACAAMEAHDAGAQVLIVEKQREATHYSNTRMSGGIFHSPDPSGDPQALKSYAKAMFSGENLPWKLEGEQPEVSDGLADAWVKYATGDLEFVKQQDPEFGGVNMTGFSGAAFPSFPGAKECKYRVFGSSYTGRADFATPTKDLPKNQKMNGEAFFTALKLGVTQRKIRVLYESPARDLVTNDRGEVIGVYVEQAGKRVSVRARRAVVVTTGGYEYNMAMRRAFLEGPGVEGWAFYGSLDNTGDGIEMAQRVGAGLMKAGKAASRLIAAVPLRHNGMKIGVITDSVGAPNSIVVDNTGNRFAAETLITTDPSRYFFYKEAIKFDILKLDYPRCPSWMIFDETFRSKRSVTAMGISTAGYGIVPWTADNQDAIKRGWILKADTLDELAAKIKAHKENRSLIEPAALAATVAKFNDACAKGKDEQFDRRANTLAPIDKPPYYAIPLYAGGPNTKGGIAANANREVLDWNGRPVPRLFTAGEISSALKFVYQGGGNLTECIVMGRVAGRNAAAMKPLA